MDYITLLQSCQGKYYMLTVLEGTTGWLETYPVPHCTAQNTIWALKKQVRWQHGTVELDNSLVNIWARAYGIELVYRIP